jgi:hypothetical protein
MMLNAQNASFGTANHDIRKSFSWKHLWKARWQQCNSFVSFNHLANHQNHEVNQHMCEQANIHMNIANQVSSFY